MPISQKHTSEPATRPGICRYWPAAFWLLAIVQLTAWAWISSNSSVYGEAKLPLIWHSALWLNVAWLFSVFCLYRLEKQAKPPSIKTIILTALSLRLVAVWAYPLLEDDMFRYLWDGYQLITHGQPYGVTPADSLNATVPAAMSAVLDVVSFPDVPTIYGPVSQLLFGLSYWLAPGEVWPLQWFSLIADMLIIVMLSYYLRPSALWLYAACPLIIKEFTITAHPDIIGAALLLAATLLAVKRYWKTAGLLLGLAISVKVIAIVVAPLLLRLPLPKMFGGKSGSVQWSGWLVLLLTVVCCHLPFIIQALVTGNTWISGTEWGGLAAMAGEWQFNAPIYDAMQQLWQYFWQYWVGNDYFRQANQATTLILFSLFAYWVYLRSNHWLTTTNNAVAGEKHSAASWPRVDWLFAVLLVISPVINPWYLMWFLPFSALHIGYQQGRDWPLWPWIAATFVWLAYGIGLNLEGSGLEAYSGVALGAYHIPNRVLAAEYGGIAFTILAIFIYRRSVYDK